jgi:hypothetical protein
MPAVCGDWPLPYDRAEQPEEDFRVQFRIGGSLRIELQKWLERPLKSSKNLIK